MADLYELVNKVKSSTLMTQPRRWSFEVRALLAREPILWPLYRPYIWWDQYNITSRGIADAEERVVGPHTEIVIDGFPGSANSFATAAFQQAQTRPVHLAHHMHSPVQIIQGVTRRLPTIVTVRDPKGAVLSLTSRWPHVTVAQGLRNYSRFYEKLLPHAGSFVISTFAHTTGHLGDVVREVNRRYGTDFTPFAPTEADLRALRRPEKFASEAWKRRQARKAERKKDFEDDALTPLIDRAEVIHATYVALALAAVPLPEGSADV